MSKVTELVKVLEEVFGEKLDELAVEHGVIRRQRKFTGRSLVRMLVLTLLKKPNATFADWALTAGQLGVGVSATAVEKRFTQPLVEFLQAACQRACAEVFAADPLDAGLLDKFTAVLIGDSTSIALPDEMQAQFPGCGGSYGGGRAALKIQVSCDLKTGALPQVVIEVGKASDAKSVIAHQPAQAGALEVFDLGYFELARFRRLAESNACFVSRLQQGTKVFGSDGTVLNLRTTLPANAQQGVVDLPVLVGVTERLSARLIAVRLPQELADRRRQKARENARDHGREITEEYSELLGWNIFITNAPPEFLSWKAIVVLYRARWQIELLFKLWKSHNRLAEPRAGAGVIEVMAVFWAKLMGVLLQHWLLLTCCWHDERRSQTKVARLLRDWIVTITSALDRPRQLKQVLQQFCDQAAHVAKIQTRKKKPSHFQLLDTPELLNWAA